MQGPPYQTQDSKSRSRFGFELAMLARGAPLLMVLQSFLGTCSAGRAAVGTWLLFLSTLPTVHIRRQVVQAWLRQFEHARQHGAQWRVVGPAGWIGPEHRWVSEELDEATGELVQLDKPKRVYCRKADAHAGLAVRQGKSARQVRRYRASMRTGGIVGSQQPNAKARDAVLPRRRQPNGRWAYGQNWCRFVPPPALIARWRSVPAEAPTHDRDAARDELDELVARARASQPRRQRDRFRGCVFTKDRAPRMDTLRELDEITSNDVPY